MRSSVIVCATGAIILLTAQVQATTPTPFQVWQFTYFGCINCPQAQLTADPDGDSQDNQTEFIADTNPTNSASFWSIQATPTNGVAPFTVNFSDNITAPSVTNRFWDFGDGQTSSGITPSHIYTNTGMFSVSETLFSLNGTATLTDTGLITAVPEPSTLLLVCIGLLGTTIVRRLSS